MRGIVTPLPHCAFMAWCSVKKAQWQTYQSTCFPFTECNGFKRLMGLHGAHVNGNKQYKCSCVYSKVSGLAAWRENCKWYNSVPLDAVVSLFCESV